MESPMKPRLPLSSSTASAAVRRSPFTCSAVNSLAEALRRTVASASACPYCETPPYLRRHHAECGIKEVLDKASAWLGNRTRDPAADLKVDMKPSSMPEGTGWCWAIRRFYFGLKTTGISVMESTGILLSVAASWIAFSLGAS